jgi:hypothetical protein
MKRVLIAAMVFCFVLFCFVVVVFWAFGLFRFESCELICCFGCSIAGQLSSQPRLACERSNDPVLIRSYPSTVPAYTNVLIHSYPSFNDPVLIRYHPCFSHLKSQLVLACKQIVSWQVIHLEYISGSSR